MKVDTLYMGLDETVDCFLPPPDRENHCAEGITVRYVNDDGMVVFAICLWCAHQIAGAYHHVMRGCDEAS
jgi:hypothetical protein